MRIAFVDAANWRYDVDTPLREPIGGSQSALCYLAVELAKRGHEVTIYNGNVEPVTKHGVTCSGAEGVKGDLDAFDAVISLNSAGLAKIIRDVFGAKKVPLILWEHHGDWQPGAQVLSDPELVKPWTAIAFVSETQRGAYRERYKSLEGVNSVVMYNGMAPPFENSEHREAENPPTLFYTSTPFRGLDVLLSVFPMIREEVPGTRLKVFSSMRVYRQKERADFVALYDAAKNMEGVEYRGSLGQAQLAEELAACAALAHPSTFPECHSIAAIEALGVGAAVLTTDLGGQREATGGLAKMIPYAPIYDTEQGRREILLPYASMVIAALKEMVNDRDKAIAERIARQKYARQHYLWKDKAADWDRWLGSLV